MSRKKIEKRQNERKNASDAIPWMPETMPWMNVERDDETAAAVPSAAFDAPDESTPRLVSHDLALSSAEVACFEISPACAAIPPITRTPMSTPRASSTSRTMTAPQPRFQPAALEPSDERRRDARDDEPCGDGPDDPRHLPERPQQHGEQADRAEQEPRRPAQVADRRPRPEIAVERGDVTGPEHGSSADRVGTSLHSG